MTTEMSTPELVKFDSVHCYTYSPKEAHCIYKEIFEDKCYDIDNLPSSPVVIDAGANIGLFSLFLKQRYPSAKILAFEPAPLSFDALSRNVKAQNLQDIQAFNIGLSHKTGSARLTYLPNLPGNSTLRPEEKQKLYMASIKKHGKDVADSYFGTSYELDIKLERLSTVLDNQKNLTTIDLLKVDVEGVELDVLRGIDDEHWKLVQNVIVETWEESGDRVEIENLLKSKDFAIRTEAAPWDPNFYMIIAKRND
ncbi:hypothetical protein NQ176_g211 [Zarea fungicola]|uniref:Uncharacterized protein n=1 Tax=Zarea fungicola TaxID=93591 RepID=A0ACC1P092_9HYPO|nr:hypothetical protein NQ176_g211 [Lecanicillium fungicola]